MGPVLTSWYAVSKVSARAEFSAAALSFARFSSYSSLFSSVYCTMFSCNRRNESAGPLVACTASRVNWEAYPQPLSWGAGVCLLRQSRTMFRMLYSCSNRLSERLHRAAGCCGPIADEPRRRFQQLKSQLWLYGSGGLAYVARLGSWLTDGQAGVGRGRTTGATSLSS